MYRKIKGPGGIQLVLDSSQVFPDDPGNGTPALIEKVKGGRVVATSTYNCALGEGVLDGGRDGDVTLTDAQLEWLDSMDSAVNEVYEAGNATA